MGQREYITSGLGVNNDKTSVLEMPSSILIHSSIHSPVLCYLNRRNTLLFDLARTRARKNERGRERGREGAEGRNTLVSLFRRKTFRPSFGSGP